MLIEKIAKLKLRVNVANEKGSSGKIYRKKIDQLEKKLIEIEVNLIAQSLRKLQLMIRASL